MSQQPPRSTPIPGEPFSAPQETAPPTPSAFLGNQPGPGQFPGAGQFPGGQPGGQFPGAGQIPGMQFGGGLPVNMPGTVRKSGGSWGMKLLVMFIVLSIVGGIGVAVFGALKAKDAVNDAIDLSNELSNPELSSGDRSALGLTGNEQFLWDGAAPAAIATALENGLDGQPTGFLSISLFPDYAIATAQNPALPDHFDRFTWRTGGLDAGTPEPNNAEGATLAFTIDQLNWTALATAITGAVAASGVEQGTISHVTVERDIFGDTPELVARIYVTGPRSSGYVQVAADGTMVKVVS
ncbi:MAG: hypothetical protein ABMA25_23875 [Ilumatobacteraceae bacterium]